ncbi:hypothetical protein [Acidipila sp. EB88]|uniref:hypothetical protein n=1 Tax=Acidipila sp. EB88 TaxID=2305226 RepID=UPI000F5FF3AD|nr:hypothetical protein [Acidipila sp. EB88]RRA49252.1 hypothetical protein D1Y84_14200 [Acidipila sp. EB88]
MALPVGWNPKQYQKQQEFLTRLLSERQAFEGKVKGSLSEHARLELMGLDKKILCIRSLITDYEATHKEAVL